MAHFVRFIATLTFLFIFGGGTAFAVEPLVVTLSPKTPGPNTDVTVRVESYLTQLDGARIFWVVDGTPQKDGVGEKSFSVTTKELGVPTVLRIVVVSGDGTRYEKELTILPGEADILWEADTYTPPFYKGKALPTYESTIRLAAIPRFSKSGSNPSLYSYSWKLDRTKEVLGGSARSSATVIATWPNSTINVQVTASEPGTAKIVSSSVNIRTVNPVIRFYESAPLLGLNFEHALSDFTSTESQLFIRGVPYFVSNEDRDTNKLRYTWVVDGSVAGNSAQPEEYLFSGSGAHNAQFSVKNTSRILQSGDSSLVVQFK